MYEDDDVCDEKKILQYEYAAKSATTTIYYYML